MKFSIGIVAALITSQLFTGCAGPGSGAVKINHSKFDNTKEVIMQRAWVSPADGGIAEISLGMTYRSSLKDKILLLANVTSMKNSQVIKDVSFSINGKIINAESVNTNTKNENLKVTNGSCFFNNGIMTCYEGLKMQSSDKLFYIPSSLAEDIFHANSAFVRVNVESKFIEGDLKASSFGNATFKDSLPEFIAEIKNQ